MTHVRLCDAFAFTKDMVPIMAQLEGYQRPALDMLSPQAARNLPTLRNAAVDVMLHHLTGRIDQVFHPVFEPVGAIRHRLIPTRAGQLMGRIYYPTDPVAGEPTHSWPLVVYFHGGGFVMGDLDKYGSSCRSLCNALQAVILSVGYRQAPECPFPGAVEDADDALQWALAHARELKGDPYSVVVAGEGSGATLATVACRRARDQNHPLPLAQLLFYPHTDLAHRTISYMTYAAAEPMNERVIAWAKRHYATGRDLHQDDLSPLLAATLAGLPPTCVVNAEIDPLCGEGLAYAEALHSHGVRTTHRLYAGMPHDFFTLANVVSEARRALQDCAAWVRAEIEGHPVGELLGELA